MKSAVQYKQSYEAQGMFQAGSSLSGFSREKFRFGGQLCFSTLLLQVLANNFIIWVRIQLGHGDGGRGPFQRKGFQSEGLGMWLFILMCG